MFHAKRAGEKSEKHCDPLDPPRRRANNPRGRGTYATDRPPRVGTIGRASGQVRLRVVSDTPGKILADQVPPFTPAEAIAYTDESNSYNHIIHSHATVEHGMQEYARDDDGNGIRKVPCLTAEGLWTDVRNVLRPFKGVHNKSLAGYVAISEFRRNLKCVSPAFISALVTFHTFWI